MAVYFFLLAGIEETNHFFNFASWIKPYSIGPGTKYPFSICSFFLDIILRIFFPGVCVGKTSLTPTLGELFWVLLIFIF